MRWPRCAMRGLMAAPFVLTLSAGDAAAQVYVTRRGGWASDPGTRRREVLAVMAVFALVSIGYVVNRLLNPSRRRGASHFLEANEPPPDEVAAYLNGLGPRPPGPPPP